MEAQTTNWKNVPNALSALRIVLSIVLFVLIGLASVEAPALYLSALIVFVLASITDFVDGWWARHYHQVTKLGRILDPFADKMLICGTFIFLCAIPELANDPCGYPTGMRPWVAVVIVSRELIITILRSYMEGQGIDFSAKWVGKIKMGFQCIAAITALLYLTLLPFADKMPCPHILPTVQWAMIVSVWITVISTVQSALVYVHKAITESVKKAAESK